MNIVIFGGGTPGRLGNLFGAKAQTQGHTVVSISHCEHPNSDIRIATADFSNVNSVNQTFVKVLDELGTVDLVLYATRNVVNSALTTKMFDSGTLPTIEYQSALTVDVLIPHQLMITAHQRKSQCHFVFFTTHLALSHLREEARYYSTYIGGKAWQLHLMRAISTIDTTIKASAFSIHFDWNSNDDNQAKFDYLYDLVMTQRQPGAIISTFGVSNAQLIELDVLAHAPFLKQ